MGDEKTVAQMQKGEFCLVIKNKIHSLQKIFEEAKSIVCQSMPSLNTLIECVVIGYDGQNNDYEGFCNGNQIIINLYSYIPKLSGGRALIHDFVITITHELAHFLEPNAGHGPLWRDAHMKMVMEVMRNLEVSNK